MRIQTQFHFPPAWLWLVDEAIPAHVKEHYSPRESWKSKPFSKEDAIFFFKGIEELSDLFTEERPKAIPAYFQHERFRSGYLLYFLPLQAAKFHTLFEMYPGAMEALLTHARKEGVMRVLDIGAGPGTASMALLLWLLEKGGRDLPPVEFHWVDTNATIMKDGKALAERFSDSFPKLRGKIKVHTEVKPWWEIKIEQSYSLMLLGHMLNESRAPRAAEMLQNLLAQSQGAGALLAEPASRISSQNLSKLRDLLLFEEKIPASPTSIWGPCLHAEACPLAEGRDWCHFSVPAQIPGVWFKQFSKSLSSERHWLKFSYLWLASPEYPSPTPKLDMRRVISDRLSRGPGPSSVLLCEPEVPGKLSISAESRIGRGDLVKIPGKNSR
jgi:hypothetical protein